MAELPGRPLRDRIRRVATGADIADPARRHRRRTLVVVGSAVTAVLIAAIVGLETTSTTSTRVGVTSSDSLPATAPTPTTTSLTPVTSSSTTAPLVPVRPASTAAPPRPTTTVGPGPASGTTTVTEADNGRSYQLRRGDRLVVNLMGPAVYSWTEPTSSDGGVLQRGTASSGTAANAVFLAAGDGQAIVSATDIPTCYPKCLPPSLRFQVDVSVTG